LEKVKKNNRTPIVLAAQDCWMNSKDLMGLLKVPSEQMLEHNIGERDLQTVYFRELAMRV
jgi:hypothetical protein